MSMRHLSYRVKIPLAISAVILLTELAVTATLVTRALRDARLDLEAGARSLTTVLARSLREPVMRDDMWQAFEVVRTPLDARTADHPLQAIVVLDGLDRVFVASDPRRWPALTPMADLPQPLRELADPAERPSAFGFRFARGDQGSELAAANAIVADDGTRLGLVLVEFDAERYYHRVRSTLFELGLVSLPGLMLLIPLGWYWGKSMAKPLVGMADALGRIGRDPPRAIAADLPPDGGDEIGRLAHRARDMLEQLARKEELEQAMVASERLAAVGRVSAAMAHEINNPLGGMINAIDTVGRHGQPDAFTRKTLGLLERGLQQIRSIVGALLVEARLDSRELSPQDWQDLRTLIEPQLGTRGIRLHWEIAQQVESGLPLPAHLLRQLVLNLLLNAVKAAPDQGMVILRAVQHDDKLQLDVANDGVPIAQELLARLFEPFAAAAERGGKRGYGLGLWICYQIVQQLNGTIEADSTVERTCVSVRVPLSSSAAGAATPSA